MNNIVVLLLILGIAALVNTYLSMRAYSLLDFR